MKRRAFVVSSLALPLLAFARADTLPPRKAVFEEVGNSVRMTLALPNLFRRHDKEALASIDSGFDTTLEFTFTVWQYGTRKKIEKRRLTVKLRRDPWKKQYVVSVRGAHGWGKRYFEKREEAIAAAVKLDRVKVCSSDQLERGEDGPYYFIEVLALRNPLRSRKGRGRSGASGRGRGRDLEWFGRLVEVLAGERAKAEETVHIRTNPFFLVPR